MAEIAIGHCGKEGHKIDAPVAASTKIESGNIVVLNSSGYAVHGSAATGLITIGIADRTVDNSSGANGAVTVPVRDGLFKRANAGGDALTRAEVGDDCYISDSATVCKTGTGKSVAGKVFDIDADGSVIVLMGIR